MPVTTIKKAILLGMSYAEKRGAAQFEATDSATEKVEYIYRLFVHDKIIQPLPEDQVSQKSMSINWLYGHPSKSKPSRPNEKHRAFTKATR